MTVAVGWDDAPDVAAWPGLPPLPGPVRADACVVGLGASGLAAVEALLERGRSVVAVDAGRVAAGAAGRNGGFLLGGPAPYLHEAIERWGAEAAVDLYRATLDELGRLESALGPSALRRLGSIRLAGLPGGPRDDAERSDRDAELADCARHAAALRAHGFAVEDYNGELGVGLFLPDDTAVNPAARVMGLAAQLSRHASLHEHTRVSTVDTGIVVTDLGVIEAELVIVAVDGRLDELLPQLVGRVRTARLQMLATAPLPARVLPCPVYARWGYDYAQQDASGRIYAGGGRDRFAASEWTLDATPTPQVQAWIEHVVARIANPIEVTHRWAASVGYTTDGRPLCVEVAPLVMACGGYSGTGNLVGPLTARAAVASALDGAPLPSWCSS